MRVSFDGSSGSYVFRVEPGEKNRLVVRSPRPVIQETCFVDNFTATIGNISMDFSEAPSLND